MIKEKTIDNAVGEVESEVLIVMCDDRLPAKEELEPVGFENDRFKAKVNFVPSFFYCSDKDFKRIYLN